jgi:CRISPR-associated protein Cmr5
MSNQTPEQRRAKHALEKVREVQAENDAALAACYRSYVDRLGPSILANGLGQAVATEHAAGAGENSPDKRAHRLLAQNLADWLCGGGEVYDGNDLLAAIVKNDQTAYLRAQAEALAWLVWHKKFCRAHLREGSSRVED